MCTGFVRRGKDVICGFNMDINIGAFDYDVYAEPDKFYIGIKNNIGTEDIPDIPDIPEGHLPPGKMKRCGQREGF